MKRSICAAALVLLCVPDLRAYQGDLPCPDEAMAEGTGQFAVGVVQGMGAYLLKDVMLYPVRALAGDGERTRRQHQLWSDGEYYFNAGSAGLFSLGPRMFTQFSAVRNAFHGPSASVFKRSLKGMGRMGVPLAVGSLLYDGAYDRRMTWEQGLRTGITTTLVAGILDGAVFGAMKGPRGELAKFAVDTLRLATCWAAAEGAEHLAYLGQEASRKPSRLTGRPMAPRPVRIRDRNP